MAVRDSSSDTDEDGPDEGIVVGERVRTAPRLRRATSSAALAVPDASCADGWSMSNGAVTRIGDISTELEGALDSANEYSLAKADGRLQDVVKAAALARASMHYNQALALNTTPAEAGVHALGIYADSVNTSTMVSAMQTAQKEAVKATERLQEAMRDEARRQASDAFHDARMTALLDLEARMAQCPGLLPMCFSFLSAVALSAVVALLVWLLADRAFSVLVAVADSVVPSACLALVSPDIEAQSASSWGLGWIGSGVLTLARCSGSLLLVVAILVTLAWAGIAGWAIWGGAAFLLVRATLVEASTAFSHEGVGSLVALSLLALALVLAAGLAALFRRRMLLRHIHSRLDRLDIRRDAELPRATDLRVDVLLSNMAKQHQTHALLIRLTPVLLTALAVVLGLAIGNTMSCAGRFMCLDGVLGAAESLRQVAAVVLAHATPSTGESV